MNWKYSNPNFEFSKSTHSTWWGHVWFAYDLISNFKPKKVVELGTHYGVSFFSMCQAAKDLNLECNLNAVDTWEGDPQAKIGYDKKNEVFDSFKNEISLHYNDLNIDIHRKEFNEAVLSFGDNSIDILHIDGFHSYEAVKHDFETWLPKVSTNGIVLSHDIHEKREGFGVHILWDELKTKYDTMEFSHYHGLGVLFKGGNLEYKDIYLEYYKILSDKVELEFAVEDFGNLKLKNEKLSNEISLLIAENNLIKSSKFWKLRNFYMYVKNGFKFLFFHPNKFFKKYFRF